MALIILASCNKDNFDFDRLSTEIELEPEIVAPLAYGSVTMEDIIEMVDSMGYTRVDDAGYIYIVYSDTAFAIKADTVVEIPDKFITKYYIESDITGDPGWGVDVGDTVYFEKLDTLSYGLGGNDRLDSMLIKAGTLQIDLLSEFRHTGFLTISSEHILDEQGNPFVTTILISDLSGNFQDQQIFDLDGFFVSTDHVVEGDSTLTFIVIDFDLALIYSGNTIEVGEECEIDMSFLDTDFNTVYGFIEEREVLSDSGEIEIPLYNENPDFANIIFANPGINLYVSNSIGISLELELDNMIATSSIDGSTMELTFNGINPFEIGAPKIDQIGESVDTEIKINNTTSNIFDLLASAPSNISYDIVGRTLNKSIADEHFIQDQSELELELEFLLPLNLKTSGYALSDTIDFDLFGEDGIDPEMVKFLQVNLDTDNGLPIEFGVQLYFTDENYIVVDSLFDGSEVILKAAPVNNDGIISASIQDETVADIDSDKLSNLMEVRYAIFHAKILTTNKGEEFVKIYTHYDGLGFEPAYALDFDLAIYGGFKINSNDLDD